MEKDDRDTKGKVVGESSVKVSDMEGTSSRRWRRRVEVDSYSLCMSASV
jgi:hypothetical protein